MTVPGASVGYSLSTTRPGRDKQRPSHHQETGQKTLGREVNVRRPVFGQIEFPHDQCLTDENVDAPAHINLVSGKQLTG